MGKISLTDKTLHLMVLTSHLMVKTLHMMVTILYMMILIIILFSSLNFIYLLKKLDSTKVTLNNSNTTYDSN